MLRDHDLFITFNHAHYDIPPRLRVDLRDKITEPITVNHLVLVSCSTVTLLVLFRVVQDSRCHYLIYTGRSSVLLSHIPSF